MNLLEFFEIPCYIPRLHTLKVDFKTILPKILFIHKSKDTNHQESHKKLSRAEQNEIPILRNVKGPESTQEP